MNNPEHHLSSISTHWEDTIQKARLLPVIPSQQPLFDFLWKASLQESQKQSKSILKLEMLMGYKPTPKRFLDVPLHQFLELGVPPKKAQFIQLIAQHALDGGGGWPTKSDLLEEKEDVLVNKWSKTIRGLQPVHLEKFLIFSMGRKNVFSLQDHEAKLGYKCMMTCEDTPSAEQWNEVKEACHPYGTLGMRCLWWHAKRAGLGKP